MTFRDHFSRQAALYSIYRPEYPPELFEFITGLTRGRTRAWDCATGSGQAAVALAKYFSEVIATDASPQQISHAEPHQRVTYAVSSADASGIEKSSVDLVTVAQALHWFDLDTFYREVRRVLKRGGAFAVWGYGDPVMDDPELEKIVHAFNRGTIEKYWQPNRDILLDGYRSVPFPFDEVSSPELRLEKRWTLAQLAGYFRTWSATNGYIAEKGTDPVLPIEAELAKLWGGAGKERLIIWPLYLRAGINSG